MTSKTICLSYPSVIAQSLPSAAHHSQTTARHGWRKKGEGARWLRDREGWGERWATRRLRESRGACGSKWGSAQYKWGRRKVASVHLWGALSSLIQSDCFSYCGVKCPVSSNKRLSCFPFFSCWDMKYKWVMAYLDLACGSLNLSLCGKN